MVRAVPVQGPAQRKTQPSPPPDVAVTRSHFASTPLVRHLGSWAPVAAAQGPSMDFAERLSLWVGPVEAIALQATLQSLRQVNAPQAGPHVQRHSLEDDIARVRATLAQAIAQDPLPPPAAGADRAKDAAWPTYLQRHMDLQRRMDRLIDPLRDHVRQALSRTSARLRQLAALDTVLAQTLAVRQERLLPTPPSLLQRRYEQLRQAHLQAWKARAADAGADAAALDDPTHWRVSGAWLHRFEQDWRQALLAEVDLRLEPVRGLAEALGAPDMTPHTP